RALLDMIGHLDLPYAEGFPAELLERQHALQQEILQLEQVQSRASEAGAPKAELDARERAIEKRMAAFARLIRKIDDADPLRRTLFSAPIVTLEGAQRMIGDEKTLAVELYFGVSGAFAVYAGTSTAGVRALGTEERIATL